MKKAIILAIILTISTFSLLAQAPPPPPGNAGTGGGPVGSTGAPIDGGLTILLAMAAAFGGKKIYQLKKLI